MRNDIEQQIDAAVKNFLENKNAAQIVVEKTRDQYFLEIHGGEKVFKKKYVEKNFNEYHKTGDPNKIKILNQVQFNKDLFEQIFSEQKDSLQKEINSSRLAKLFEYHNNILKNQNKDEIEIADFIVEQIATMFFAKIKLLANSR